MPHPGGEPTVSRPMDPPGAPGPCLRVCPEGILLDVKVAPNASRTEARGLRQGRLRVRVKARPVEDQANKALRKWAGETFGLRVQHVEIARGRKHSEKTLLLRGADWATVARALYGLLPEAG